MDTEAAILDGPTGGTDLSETRPARVGEVELAAPGREEVLVDIAAASLCHTDVSVARGEMDRPFPMVMGHEGAGVVRSVGEGVESVAPGDHVVLGRTACGRCEFCRRGRGAMCEVRSRVHRDGTLRTGGVRFERHGEPIHHFHGVSSFAEHTVVTEEVAIPISEEVPLEQAPLLGCGLFTGFGAVANTADVEAGSSVAVFGVGGVGLSAIQGASLRGASRIIAVDIQPEKLERATRLGATHTIDGDDDPAARIREIVPGGVDYAVEAVGHPVVASRAVASLGRTGTAVLVGTPPAGTQDVGLDLYDLVTGEQSIVGSFNGSYTLPIAVPKLAALVADGQLSLSAMITDTKPLSGVNEAMADLEAGNEVRQVLLP